MAHILLIEPNPLLAATYRQALQQVGHEVVLVAGAQAAIEEADQHTPDAVVLELQLPQHGGVEFLYEFRSYAEWQQIPVILHTATTMQALGSGWRVLQQHLGVRAYLYKPQTSLKKLTHVIRRVVGVTT